MADDKKIIIDEDWKSQVQAEKEAAAQTSRRGEPSVGEPRQQAGQPSSGRRTSCDPPMPPASFEMLRHDARDRSARRARPGAASGHRQGAAAAQSGPVSDRYARRAAAEDEGQSHAGRAADARQLAASIADGVRRGRQSTSAAPMPSDSAVRTLENHTQPDAAGILCQRSRIHVTCTPLPFDDGGYSAARIPALGVDCSSRISSRRIAIDVVRSLNLPTYSGPSRGSRIKRLPLYCARFFRSFSSSMLASIDSHERASANDDLKW